MTKQIQKLVFATLLCSLLFSTNLVLAADIADSASAPPPAAVDTGLVKPNVIPCRSDSLLPCITDTTQEKGGGSIRDYVLNRWGTNFISAFLGLVAIGSVIFIIVGGVQMLLAVGNEEELGKAKKTILWAIVGLVLAMFSVAIVSIISKLF
jgi:hypothetical protein